MIGVVVSRTKPAAPRRMTSSEPPLTATAMSSVPLRVEVGGRNGDRRSRRPRPAPAAVKPPSGEREQDRDRVVAAVGDREVRRPSPSKSPAAMPVGCDADRDRRLWTANVAPPLFSSTDNAFDAVVGDGDVGLPVGVEVRDGDLARLALHGVVALGATENPSLPGLRRSTRDVCRAVRGGDEVGAPVAVEVTRADGAELPAERHGLAREAAGGVAQRDHDAVAEHEVRDREIRQAVAVEVADACRCSSRPRAANGEPGSSAKPPPGRRRNTETCWRPGSTPRRPAGRRD